MHLISVAVRPEPASANLAPPRAVVTSPDPSAPSDGEVVQPSGSAHTATSVSATESREDIPSAFDSYYFEVSCWPTSCGKNDAATT